MFIFHKSLEDLLIYQALKSAQISCNSPLIHNWTELSNQGMPKLLLLAWSLPAIPDQNLYHYEGPIQTLLTFWKVALKERRLVYKLKYSNTPNN